MTVIPYLIVSASWGISSAPTRGVRRRWAAPVGVPVTTPSRRAPPPRGRSCAAPYLSVVVPSELNRVSVSPSPVRGRPSGVPRHICRQGERPPVSTARNGKFESISLQRRVCEPSVTQRQSPSRSAGFPCSGAAPVRAERQFPETAAMAFERNGGGGRTRQVPQPRRVVIGPGHHPHPVRAERHPIDTAVMALERDGAPCESRHLLVKPTVTRPISYRDRRRDRPFCRRRATPSLGADAVLAKRERHRLAREGTGTAKPTTRNQQKRVGRGRTKQWVTATVVRSHTGHLFD
jgi:hypothetical protein